MNFLVQEADLQLKDKIQALYFYSSWLPYHKKMLVMIDKIEQKYSNVEFIAIDVDQLSNQCKRFNISLIPTVIILQNGKELKRIEGLVMTSAFKSAFADICNTSISSEKT